ncbi:MAG: TatD family hydrolase [Candidatus Schekmanbacteria bacterium]|nr:TatD family hydrolase [Candidatus Schekmanbacteria bacterium]
MLDAHCHLDDPRFADDLDEVLARARAAGVRRFVVAGVGPARWPRQCQLAENCADISVTFGMHPWLAAQSTPAELEQAIAGLVSRIRGAGMKTPVGIGEIGLDRSPRVPADSQARQRFAFRMQLDAARSLDLPVVLHVVRAHDTVLEILGADGAPTRGGMVHGFSASPEIAEAYQRLGFHISLGGAITAPNARKVRAAAARVREHLLLCETDSPDGAPYGSGGRRNEPANLPEIVRVLADLRDTSPEHIASLTYTNARSLFLLEN